MSHHPKPVAFEFTSTRAMKRLGLSKDNLQTGKWNRRSRPSKARNNRKRQNHAKYSVKIRDIVAPSLVGRYELVLIMQRYYEQDHADQEDAKVVEIVKNLIPGRFKIAKSSRGVFRRRHRGRFRKYQDNIASCLHRIYLTHESDLFALQLTIPTRIWRIMRIVAERTT